MNLTLSTLLAAAVFVTASLVPSASRADAERLLTQYLARPDAELTKQLVAEAARRGLVLLSCGTYANVVRILVPLTASDALLDEGLAILGASFDALA